MTRPTFGEYDPSVTYQTRYGVYAVIPDVSKERIVLVQAPNGAWFLPGGEIEAGEDHQEALARELLEELGFEAVFETYYGQADDYFYSRHRDTHYYHPAYFYGAEAFEKIAEPLEDFNQIGWFSVEEAKTLLKRGSHQWAVAQWQDQQKNVSDFTNNVL